MTEAPTQEINTNQEIVAAPPTVPVTPSHASDQSHLMNLIAKMASDPAADVPKLERLIKLRNDEIAAQAKRDFDADFVVMKPKLPRVIKLHDNAQTKSKYAKHEDVNQAVDPILAQYGFGTSSNIINQTDTHITMRTDLLHKGGHSESLTLTMPIDDKGMNGTVNKTQPHGISSTIMYLRRVSKCALLDISTGDDNDGNKVGDQTLLETEQAADIDLRVRKFGEKYFTQFLKFMKVDSVQNIRKSDYMKAVNQVAATEAEAAKRKAAAEAKKV